MKIVCVSGYFDPLHVGHLEYFHRAKSLGDKLVVIVNNDQQAIMKKGYVFMPLKERLRILEAIRWVDSAVASVDTDRSVNKTLEILKPDIFANGGDVHECREESVCRRLGIQMVFGLGEKIQSSSELVKKAKGKEKK